MGIFAKILKVWRNRWLLRALVPSIVFNLRHLPFKQARHLPILLYKGRLSCNAGSFSIQGPVSFGMIKLGVNRVSLLPNSGIMLENRGSIVFHGSATIGNASAIAVGEDGILDIGNNFYATSGLCLACYHRIRFEDDVLIGWNTMLVDSDFHRLKYLDTGMSAGGYGPVTVGHNVWIANGCKIYKNVSIPHSCVVGADTILHRIKDVEPYSLITNKIETVVKVRGIYHDREDDKIDYKS